MHIDAKARDSLTKTKTIKVRIAEGMSAHCDRIKIMQRSGKHTDLPMCKAE